MKTYILENAHDRTRRTGWRLRFVLAPLLLALLSAGAAARGQGFAMNWSSLDGGGGSSVGGAFHLRGTIGQIDAGVLSGGAFTVIGGFWGAASMIGPPSLTIERQGGAVTIAWPGPARGYVLQGAPALAGTGSAWGSVPVSLYETNGGFIRVTLDINPGHQFYRLRRP